MVGTWPRVTSDIIERGTIIVDVIARTSRTAIWRGTVASRLNQETTREKRVARVNEGVRRLFERFPVSRSRQP